jgi:hypothetical protein
MLIPGRRVTMTEYNQELPTLFPLEPIEEKPEPEEEYVPLQTYEHPLLL